MQKIGISITVVLLMLLFVQAWPSAAQQPEEAGSGLPRVAMLVRADNPIDAFSASAVAAQLGGVVLLTSTDELSQAAQEGLALAQPDLVILAGGTAALSDNVSGQVEALGYTVRRLSGADRLETSAALSSLLAEFGVVRPLLEGVPITGGVDFAGTVHFAEPAEFAEGANFAGGAEFAEGANFAGAAEFAGSADFAGAAEFAGGADFAGAAEFAEGANFAGAAEFADGAGFAGGVDLVGAAVAGLPFSQDFVFIPFRPGFSYGYSGGDGQDYVIVQRSESVDSAQASYYALGLNPAAMPLGVQFRITVHLASPENMEYCFRLHDLTVGAPVESSQFCQVGSAPLLRLQSPVFELPAESHDYVITWRPEGSTTAGVEGVTVRAETVGG